MLHLLVPVGLLHLGVDVEAGVSELGDLFGEELYSLGALTEDDGLVDVELGEQGVQAMDLLLLLEVGVVLRHTF